MQFRQYSFNKLKIFLLLSVLFEILLLTFLRGKLGLYLSPIFILLFGITTAILPLFIYSAEIKIQIKKIKVKEKTQIYFLFAICTFLFYLFYQKIIDENQINYHVSDIIPSIEIYVVRFIKDEYPYSLITVFDYPLPPTYLPMMWFPFIGPELLNIDYRWMAYLILLIGLIFYINHINSLSLTQNERVGKTLLPFLILFSIAYCKPGEIANSVELMIVGYYLILIYAILSGRYLIFALAIVLCLLSRFSFLFWLPYAGIVILIYEGIRKTSIIALLVTAGILIFYIIPFLSKDWSSFQKGLDYYTFAAMNEWKGQSWQDKNDTPHQLNQGMGFGIYFYRFLEVDLLDRIKILKTWHLIISILSVIIFSALHYFKFKAIDHKLVLICGLKFCLCFFYAFIQVPYIYLFIPLIFISVFIISTINFEDIILKKEESFLS